MNHESLEVRVSALPLAFICPGSTRRPSLPVVDTSVAKRLGTAAHEVLQSLAETGSIDWALIPGAATRNAIDPEELRVLCATAQKLWPAIRASFPDAMAEFELSADLVPGLTMTGHVDALTVRATAGRALDWKTGRKDRDYSQQVKGYAALVLANHPELEEATGTIVWLRDQSIENYTMKRAALGPWVLDLAERVIAWDGTYQAGHHCTECPRSHECQAANAMVRRDVAAFSDKSIAEHIETDIATMAPAAVVELHRKASTVAFLAHRVKAAIKDHVLAHGDVVGDGVMLTIEEGSRRALNPLEAWPVLEAAGLTSAELAGCMRLFITSVEDVVAKKAGRGKGAGAIRKLEADLEKAGAITTEKTETLKERRT